MTTETQAEARVAALTTFIRMYPNLPTCGSAWNAAFDAGVAHVEVVCICGGRRAIKVEGYGWCRCPGCVPLLHLIKLEGNQCSYPYDEDTVTDEREDVTCPDCLQAMLVEVAERE